MEVTLTLGTVVAAVGFYYFLFLSRPRGGGPNSSNSDSGDSGDSVDAQVVSWL